MLVLYCARNFFLIGGGWGGIIESKAKFSIMQMGITDLLFFLLKYEEKHQQNLKKIKTNKEAILTLIGTKTNLETFVLSLLRSIFDANQFWLEILNLLVFGAKDEITRLMLFFLIFILRRTEKYFYCIFDFFEKFINLEIKINFSKIVGRLLLYINLHNRK